MPIDIKERMITQLHLMKLFAACVLMIGTLAVVAAQTPERPQFRSGVTLVELEVSVVDRDGQPVSRLQQSDFTVRESGQPQKIVSVTERGFSAGQPVNQPAPGPQAQIEPRLVTIVLDDAQIPIDARITSRTKTIARTIIESLDPSDMAAVVFTRKTRRSADFTTSHSHLAQVADGFLASNTGSGTPGFASAYLLMHEIRTSLNVLESIARHLGTVPGRRKAIFYVSPGVSLPGQGSQDYSQALQSMRRVFDEAQRANVMIHAIDPAGQSSGPGTAIAESGAFESGAVGGLRTRHEFLIMLALNTGGRSIVDRNNPERSVRQLLTQHRQYYELVYESTVAQTEQPRKIEVQVARPDATARFRSLNTAWTP